MSFRFLKKRDGTKVLQEQVRTTGGYTYRDIPMVEEKGVKDAILFHIGNFKTLDIKRVPDGILLGEKEHGLLRTEAAMTSLYPERGYQTFNFEGIPVHKHPAKIEGIYFIIEAR